MPEAPAFTPQEMQSTMPPIIPVQEHPSQPETPEVSQSPLKRLVRKLMAPLSMLRGK